MANLVPPTEEIARAKKPPKEHKMIMANLVPPTEEIARAKKPPKGHKMTVKPKFSKVTLNPKFSKASVKFLKKHTTVPCRRKEEISRSFFGAGNGTEVKFL